MSSSAVQPRPSMVCPKCNGTCIITIVKQLNCPVNHSPGCGASDPTRVCKLCNGRGYIMEASKVHCNHCGGVGRVFY